MFQNAHSASILKRYLVLISILIVAQLTSLKVEAKPLNQYQVKFRRLPPKEFSAALGSSITIECEAGASPPPTIHWLKDGKRVQINEFDDNQLDDFGQNIPVDDVNRIALSATRSRLFIDCADLADEATYTCVAENAYTRISSHTKLNLIRPAVQLAPVGGNGEENDYPVAGNGGISGGPYDDVNSLSELATANSVGGVSSGSNGAGGALKSVDGQGQHNRRQQTTKAAAAAAAGIGDNLALSAVPQCLSDRLNGRTSPQVPVRIHMWTHNIVEIMKNNVIIYCRSNIRPTGAAAAAAAAAAQQQQSQLQFDLSSGDKQQQLLIDSSEASPKALMTSSNDNSKTNQKALVSWTLPDDKLVSDDQKDKYEILETGDLMIKDLRWSDMGSYVCTVSNEHSSDSVSSFVYPASVKVNSKRSAAAVAAAAAAAAVSRNLSIR